MKFDEEAPEELKGQEINRAAGGLVVKKKKDKPVETENVEFKKPSSSMFGLQALAKEKREEKKKQEEREKYIQDKKVFFIY